MQFEWTSFYSEFATKLLEFKDNRAELIADIQSAYSAINMKLPKLESEDSIIPESVKLSYFFTGAA